MKRVSMLTKDLFYYGNWCLEILAYLMDGSPVEVVLEGGLRRRTISFEARQDGVRRITCRFAAEHTPEDQITAGAKYRELGGREWVRSGGKTVSTKKLEGTPSWFNC
jgi:hypothetical protein